MSFVIVLGNEKGGTGKSTVSMHLITSLLRDGYKVGSIDVDARQGTLSRYVENRILRAKAYPDEDLPIPNHVPVFRSSNNNIDESKHEEEENLKKAMESLSNMDFIVIDTPGSDMHLSRLAHSYADTLITPMNDSFIDLDMLARVDPETHEVIKPSTYSEMVWEQKKNRALRDRRNTDWIVLRNRMSSLGNRNKEEMETILLKLAKRIGFRLIHGFCERVIFRELFLNGITLLDIHETKTKMNMSHVAARQEMQNLIQAIKLPSLNRRVA